MTVANFKVQPTPKAEFTTIPPERATQILEHNPRNRPLINRTVAYYANMLKAGQWMLNGESVIIDWNGDLCDGQHRLWACIETGIPLQTLLVTGVDPKSFATVDGGMKRTGGQVLTMANVPNGVVVGSIIRSAYAYAHRNLRLSIPAVTMVDYEAKHSEALQRAAQAAHRIKTPFWSKWLGGLLFVGDVYFDRPGTSEEMADVFATGHGEIGSPFHAAREFMSIHRGNRDKKLSDEVVVEVLTKAWRDRNSGKLVNKYNLPRQWSINLPEFNI